jgi:hypothetical protein
MQNSGQESDGAAQLIKRAAAVLAKMTARLSQPDSAMLLNPNPLFVAVGHGLNTDNSASNTGLT